MLLVYNYSASYVIGLKYNEYMKHLGEPSIFL